MSDGRRFESDGGRPATDRGQTEVLGYVLIFSVIVLTVALVTISGQAGLVELRDNQRTANVEKGFSVLADNVDDVVQKGVPSRATELGLSGETVSLGDPVTVRVSASDASNGTELFNRTASLRPIVYRADDGVELTYAGGAVVVRGESDGVAMLREPRLVLSAERTVVPIANTSLDRDQLRGSPAAVDRESQVLVRTERRGSRVATADEEVELTITVESPRAAAWENYLDEEIDSSSDVCSLSGETVSCTYTTDEAAVVFAQVAVSFE